MTKTAHINARVEGKLKKDAEEVLGRVGVKTSEAITMFLRQVVLHKGLPFEVRLPNEETREAIAQLRAGKGEVYKGSTADIFDAVDTER